MKQAAVSAAEAEYWDLALATALGDVGADTRQLGMLALIWSLDMLSQTLGISSNVEPLTLPGVRGRFPSRGKGCRPPHPKRRARQPLRARESSEGKTDRNRKERNLQRMDPPVGPRSHISAWMRGEMRAKRRAADPPGKSRLQRSQTRRPPKTLSHCKM